MTGELENSPAGEHDSLSAQYGNFLAFASTLWAAPNWILRKNMVIDFSKLLPQEYEVRTTVGGLFIGVFWLSPANTLPEGDVRAACPI